MPITFRQEAAPEFRRRAYLLMTIVSIAFVFLIGRLFFLEIIQVWRFTYLLGHNRIRSKGI